MVLAAPAMIVARLGEESMRLSTDSMEVRPAHAGVAAQDHAGVRQSGVFAQGAWAPTERCVVHFEDRHVTHALGISKGDP